MKNLNQKEIKFSEEKIFNELKEIYQREKTKLETEIENSQKRLAEITKQWIEYEEKHLAKK